MQPPRSLWTGRERVRPLATFLECRLGSDVNGHWLHKHVRNSSGHKSHQNAKHSFNHITESADTGTGSRWSPNKIEKFQTFNVLLEQSRPVSQLLPNVRGGAVSSCRPDVGADNKLGANTILHKLELVSCQVKVNQQASSTLIHSAARHCNLKLKHSATQKISK